MSVRVHLEYYELKTSFTGFAGWLLINHFLSEVSRSLDEDEDPDDLGSDDSDVKQEAAIQTQTKQQHPSPKVEVKVQTTPTNKMSSTTNSVKTVTKTNARNNSKKHYLKTVPKKGSFQRQEHPITKLAVLHSSVGENKIQSKVSAKKRIMRGDKKLLPPFQHHSSHRTSPVTEKRLTTNLKSIVKIAEGHSSSVAKPIIRASPSKVKPTAKVTPATKGEKAAETRHRAQSISTEEYSKIKHYVKHLGPAKKTVTVRTANSGAIKNGKENQRNTFKSSVQKTNWLIPRIKEGFSEGSASGDEQWSGENDHLGRANRSFNGEDLDLSGNDKYLSNDNDFSGDNSDFSGEDDNLSGEDMDFATKDHEFSGENNDLRWDEKDSSGNDTDLMEDNNDFTGDDIDFLEDNDVKKITDRAMQEKTYVGEDKEGQRRRKIDLVKDLDELGSDDEDIDHSNKEKSKLASRKVSNLPKNVTSGMFTTKKKSKVDGYEETNSGRVNAHQKQQQDQEATQASTVLRRRIGRPLQGKNVLKNGANVETRPRQSGLVKHSVIVGSLGAKRLKDDVNDGNGKGQIVTRNVKANGTGLNSVLASKKSTETNKQFKSKKERTIKSRDVHKGQRMIKSVGSTTKLSMSSDLKPKEKSRSKETSQPLIGRTQSEMNKQGQIIKKYKQATKSTKYLIIGASSSRKTIKKISPRRGSKTALNAIGTVHKKTTVSSQKRKMETLKDAVRSQKHLKSKDGPSKSESSPGNVNAKGDNTKKEHRKSLESAKFQDFQNLQSKERQIRREHRKLAKSESYRTIGQKDGERKLTNSNSTLESTEDLMHYAHRKLSLKHKPSVNRHVQPYLPTTKRATGLKTTSRQQHVTVHTDIYRNYKTNHTETAQAKSSYIHPKVRASQNERKSLHTKPTTSKHPTTATLNKRTHDKLVGHTLLLATTRSHSHDALAVLSINKPDDVSSNKNVSLVSHPTFSSSPQLINGETNFSAPIHTSSSNALLSLKRSNTNTSDTKASVLAHFHQAESNGSDGVDFSVKSHGKHHRRKGKHEDAIDLEDLGDADFDIMMSNDIPHKDLPKKRKGTKRDHKHTEKGEGKQRNTKDYVRGKKKRKDNSYEKNEEDVIDDSERGSAESHSSHKHKVESEEIKKSTTKKHHQHHYHHGDGADKDQDEQKEDKKKSHQRHRKHDKSRNSEQKDSENRNRHHNTHRKHSHLIKKVENDDDDDNNNSVKSIHAKHHHKKVKTDDSREDDSENDGEKESRHHHKHNKHYDDNLWEGKIIPGKVKLTYDEDSDKKRDHKHYAGDDDENSEIKKEHHGRNHHLKEHKTHSDSEEGREFKKHHRHSKEKTPHTYEHEDDDYPKKEEHKEYREDDEARHQFKDRHKDEDKDRAEKRTDVNYEVVKKDQHRLGHKETNGDDDSESSKRKNDSDENQNSDQENEEDKGSADDDNGNSENTSHNRVVLGEDSESDDDDEDKHAEESRKSRNRHGHRKEHGDNERADTGYDVEDQDSTSHEGDYKPAFHNRHELERHWESKHKHFQSHEESNTDDDHDDNNDDGNNNLKHSRRNFRKSFIYHRKRKKQGRLRQHHEKERGREEEYHKDNQDEEFHVHKQNSDYIYKHRHRHNRPRDGPKDSFRHDEGGYGSNHERNQERTRGYEKQREESEMFRDQMKTRRPNVEIEEHNDERFHHEKDQHHSGYISRERDHDERKFKEDLRDRNFPDSRHRHEQDAYKDRLREGEKSADNDEDHRPYYNEGRKYEPRHREKEDWKHRHYHEDEEHDLEGTGGSFDSSAWVRDENPDDDHYYGGEGNHEYHRKKHRKHNHRKHRQSYEYWAYREQNPYNYNYNYRKSRPRYGYYKPQPTVRHPPRWHKYHYGDYGRWKPKPTSWYPNKEHWDTKPSWRLFEENKPTLGYQWHTFYSDRGITNQPKPTPFPMEPPHAWPPTNPRWQQPDQSQRKFRGDTWSPGLGQSTEKQYNDWSNIRPSAPLNRGGDNYRAQQNLSGLQPSRNLGSMPNHQQQPQGVQTKYGSPTQPNTNGVVSQTRFRPTFRRQYQVPQPSQVSSPTNISQIKSIMDKLNTPPSTVGGLQAGRAPTVNPVPIENNANNKSGLLRTNLTSGDQLQDRNRLNGFFNEENGGKKKSEIVKPTNVSHVVKPAGNSSSSGKITCTFGLLHKVSSLKIDRLCTELSITCNGVGNE